jgi:DNA-directed RNA polymerase specialized sigma54-like protein
MSKQIHEEDADDKITFRLPKRLKSEFRDQTESMSAALEQFVRDYVGQSDDEADISPLDEPDDREEAIAYRHLCRLQKNGSVRSHLAENVLSQALDHRSADTVHTLLKQLESRGYVKLRTDTPPNPRGYYTIYVRPFSKAHATESQLEGESHA